MKNFSDSHGFNLRTEDKENKARVISQEVKNAKKGVEFLLQKVKLQNRSKISTGRKF